MSAAEEKDTSAELRGRLSLLESVVSKARDAVLVTEAGQIDEPGPKIVYANESFTRTTGYSLDEILGKSPRFLQGPETDRAQLEEIRAALRRREPVRVELINYRKDGTQFWVEIDVAPVVDEDGHHTHWVSVQRDVTERRRQQEALRESEERLRTILVQYASDLITILEADGTIRYGSPAVETLLGYKPEELVGKNILDYVHPEDAGLVAKEMDEILEKPGVSEPVEVCLWHKDGSWRCLEGIGNNLVNDPAVGGIVINSRDVIGRKKAEKQLRSAEERYRALVEQIPAAIYIQKPIPGQTASYNTSYMSPRIQEILDYPAQKFIEDQDFWNELIHPDDLDEVVSEDGRTDESGEPFSMEYRLFCRDGRVVWVRDEAELIRGPEGESPYWQGVITDVTKRRQAREDLRESEERYRSVAESVREVIFQTDAEGRYTFLNSAWEEITGCAAEESLGKSYLEFIHPDDLQHNLEDFEQMGEHRGDYMEYEARFRAKDGSPHDVEIKFQEHFDGHGNPVGTSGTINDITERKETERKLQESERRFRQLFEQSVDAMYVHDEEGRFVDCNSKACALLGYTRDELLSMSVADISNNVLTEEERARQEAEDGTLWQRALAGELGVFSQGHEEENLRKDGTIVPVEVRVGSVDYGGRRMLLVSVRDITDRRRAEEALRRSEERFRGAFENASTGVALVSLDNHYLRVNRVLCEMLGYSEEELVGKRSFDFTHPEDQMKSRTRSRRISGEGGPETMWMEKRYLRKDGGMVWAISNVSLVRDLEGNPSHFVSHFQDITERKELEEQLSYQALHDSLTGLPNRSLLQKRFEQVVEHPTARLQGPSDDLGRYVGVLFLDLDGFKEVNDSMGHEMGDRLLQEVAGRLRGSLRAGDVAARFGGDEFCILFNRVSGKDEAIHAAERLRADLEAPFPLGGSMISLSASIGVAVKASALQDVSLDELLREADAAMYRTKKRGGAFYDVVEISGYAR